MQLEQKGAYFEYIKDLDRMGVAHPSNCQSELRKRFPNLTENTANRLINLYIKEELEQKQTLLLG